MLFQEEANSRGRQRRPELHRVRYDGIEIKKFDHLERTPDLFPTAGIAWCVEHIDERSLERRHANGASGVALFGDIPLRRWKLTEQKRQLHRHELEASKTKGSRTCFGDGVESWPNGV